jgi:hypothetical protein
MNVKSFVWKDEKAFLGKKYTVNQTKCGFEQCGKDEKKTK